MNKIYPAIITTVLLILPFTKLQADQLNDGLGRPQHQALPPKTEQVKANRLIELGNSFLLKPGEDTSDLQMARNHAASAAKINRGLKSDLLAGQILLLTSQIEKEAGNKHAGQQKLKDAIQLFQKNAAPGYEGLALMELRHYYDWAGPGIQDRVRVVKQAIARFSIARDKLNEANANVELGDLYQLQENATEAILALRRAISLYQQVNHRNLQSVYNLIGHIYTATGDLKNGLMYGQLAVQTVIELNDTSIVAATTYNRLAVTYSKMDRLETALGLLQKALSISIKNNWDDGTVQILGNIIDLSIKRGGKMNPQVILLEKLLAKKYNKISTVVRYTIEEDLRMFFIRSRNLSKAKYYLDRCLLYESEGNVSFNTHLFFDAVEFYLLVGELAKAKVYLRKMEALKDKANDPFISQQYFLVSYKTDSALGDFRNAFLGHINYKINSDSLKARRSRYEIKVMAARYDLENKDAEIKLKSENIRLLEKDVALQQEIALRSNKLRNITIVAMIILILLLLTLYSRSRIVKKYSRSTAKKNIYLQKLVKEKEWLIREVHHRVKNNLQMIISLIDSQASYLSNDALYAVMDSKHRIEAMSLIHQKLYLTDNTSTINMQIYIKELVTYLRESLGVGTEIGFKTDVDDISLDVSHAIPVGLILNEAITNSIKYAFQGSVSGEICVDFKYCDTKNVILRIGDSGIGLPEGFNPREVTSLGMSLMYGLATEVSGALKIEGTDGTNVSLTFSLPDLFFNRHPFEQILVEDD